MATFWKRDTQKNIRELFKVIMSKIELLAPAKDLECAKSAIMCGADAVYIGAKNFGARKAAGNNLDDIKELIEFTHKYYARTYITVNTILNNDEILEAKKLIDQLYELGADAIIIQDLGLLELNLPPVPLIASTQMHNNSLEKIRFLEQVGFKRVILARELTLVQIKEIADNVKIELEAFVHGSLCVSYSGQCYLSYAIGGRSGNRGECAQPCRNLYSLQDKEGTIIAKDQHLLSLKDLNLSDNIERMLQSGITSFKIEGRLKDSNYVKNVVSYYRQKIDRALSKLNLKKSSSGESSIDFVPNLNKTFNRGYTTYLLKGRNDKIASPFTCKSLGEPIGKVKQVEKYCFILKTATPLNNGDGICFFDSNNHLQGTTIQKVQGNKIFPKDLKEIKTDTLIYRNLDNKFLKALKNAKIERFITIKLSVTQKNTELILHAIDEDNVEACSKITLKTELAKDSEMMLNNLKKQLTKLGDSEFKASEIDINLEKIYFMPIKDINELRRTTIELLKKNRSASRPKDIIHIVPDDVLYPYQEVDFSANVYNDYAVAFYKRHGVRKIELAAETKKDLSAQKVMTTKLCLKYEYGFCPKQSSGKSVKEPLYLVDKMNKLYRLSFDCVNCQMEIYY